MDDHELLRAYAVQRKEDAFQTLAQRYLPLVYSAALRQTGNSQAAEDIAQAVFLTLAQKARLLSREVVLSGWLLRTTRYAAANARRLEQRRQHYEREAMQAHLQSSETNAAWQRITPMLDEAVDALADKDRDALVLRFFDGMSLRLVAERLGVSEDGAQKRVSRALEKLRRFFERRGRVVASGALAAAISANAVQSAPAISLRGTSQAAHALAQATLNTLARMRLQIVGVRAAAVLVLLGVAVLPFVQPSARRNLPAAPSAAKAAGQPVAFSKPVTSAVAAETQSRQLLLRAMDAQTGAPVSHARLILVSNQSNSSRSTNVFVADANGSGLVSYSPEPVKGWMHRIEIFRDGYVPRYVQWSEYQLDRIDEIPAEYTVKVDPAVTIGGVVVDEQDRPIPEARVVFSMTGPTQSRSRERLTMMGNYHSEVTDADGRWTCNHVPARFGVLTFRPKHPQFQEKSFIPDSPDAPPYVNVDRIPEADFRAGRAFMRLERGLIIAGVVSDEHARPIAGAKVTQGAYFYDPDRSRISDTEGAFRFENGRPRETPLTVEAAGYGPVVTSIVLKAHADQLRIVLPPGKTLVGRVVDESGNGIPGASVTAASPRGDSSVLFEWRAKTDVGGRFSWDSAPATQEYAVNASGFESVRRVTLVADAGEQVVRLTKQASTAVVRIYGQLLDAETRQPLKGTIKMSQTDKDGSTFTTHSESVLADGKFRLKTSSLGTLSYILEAQANGYWPQRVTNKVTADTEASLDFALLKAPHISGTVVTPTGSLAAGATLVVGGRDDWARMHRPGRFQVGTDSTTAGTLADDEGRFQLPTKYGAETVLVAHPEGFVELSYTGMTSNMLVRLQPWGRIEGLAQLGGRPLVNEAVRLAPQINRSPRMSISLAPRTDTNGRFFFDMVPPGAWKVQREINKPAAGEQAGARMVLVSHAVLTEVRAGENSTIVLGGTGRAVSGKAVAPGMISPDLWTRNSATLVQTDRASEYRAMFGPDGSFRIEDVPAGEYLLKLSLIRPWTPADGNQPNFNSIAALEKPVVVRADSDLDLGLLELQPVNSP